MVYLYHNQLGKMDPAPLAINRNLSDRRQWPLPVNNRKDRVYFIYGGSTQSERYGAKA